jgi:hypothetical protein
LLAVNHVLHHRLGEREIRERRDIDRYLHRSSRVHMDTGMSCVFSGR